MLFLCSSEAHRSVNSVSATSIGADYMDLELFASQVL